MLNLKKWNPIQRRIREKSIYLFSLIIINTLNTYAQQVANVTGIISGCSNKYVGSQYQLRSIIGEPVAGHLYANENSCFQGFTIALKTADGLSSTIDAATPLPPNIHWSSNGLLYFDTSTDARPEYIELIDLTGRVVTELQVPQMIQNPYSLPTKGLRGLYILRIKFSNNQSQQIKIIIS